jgi:hypothetical protein
VKGATLVALIGIVVLVDFSEPANADFTAIDFVDGLFGTTVANSTHGWEFVANAPITVTRLGLFDFHRDGFIESYPIGLFRLNDSSPLTSGVIDAGVADPLQGDFRYIDTPDVTLSPGTSYVISFYSRAAGDFLNYSATGLTNNAAISLTTGRFETNSGGLKIPNQTSNLDHFGPNFLFVVAEPNTMTTVPAAAAFAVLFHWRRKRRSG